MKRAKRHKSNPEHREKVLHHSRDRCDICKEPFAFDSTIQGHHSFGPRWKRNCKSWEEPIEIDYRLIRVHEECHRLAHAGIKTDEAVVEVLREIYGSELLDEKLCDAGYIQ